MFDVVFISYDEPNAEDNWSKLREQVPYAMRIHGVEGIANAHIEAAKQVSTTHFYCIDADNIVDDSFDYDIMSTVGFDREDNRVHVWGCRNPVNGLEYGYGGVKLFPTNHVEFIEEYSVDFCTSVAAASGGFKFHKEVVSTTHFNTSPYNAWKSGFRECAKLASSIIVNQNDEETNDRLSTWISVGMDAPYGLYAVAGARMGAVEGYTHREKHKEDLQLINDFSWCKKKYNNEVNDVDVWELIEEYGKILDDVRI